MKTSHAGGRKTQNDAARLALGNMLEQHVESLLAAMTKEVGESLARAAQEDYAPSRQSEVGTATRLASSCAALISATARLRGEFEHTFVVKHVHTGWPLEEVAEEDAEAPPLLSREEIPSFTVEELLRELPIRKARYEAQKAAARLAERKTSTQSASAQPNAEASSAPARASEVRGAKEDEGGKVALIMDEIEAQTAALEEDAFSDQDLDEDDGEED